MEKKKKNRLRKIEEKKNWMEKERAENNVKGN